MAKKVTKKTSGAPVGLLAGLAVATLAGAYFLYGKNGAKNRKKIQTWTLRAKADVLEKLEKAREISKETFESAVDDISAKYSSKVKNISADDVAMFAKDLKKHWKDISAELRPKVNKVVKAVKKTSAKTAKKTK